MSMGFEVDSFALYGRRDDRTMEYTILRSHSWEHDIYILEWPHPKGAVRSC